MNIETLRDTDDAVEDFQKLSDLVKKEHALIPANFTANTFRVRSLTEQAEELRDKLNDLLPD